jgi:photosystem II stability/assembly factor-like uncharacterized protein
MSKNTTSLFACFLLVFAFSLRSYSQVFCGASSGSPNNSLVAMKQMTSEAGWARSHCRLYWTSDNGQQWKDITPPMSASQTLEDTIFVDDTHGWAALRDYSEDSKRPFALAITEDGGATWKVQALKTSSTPDIAASHGGSVGMELQLADQMHGWVFFGTGSQLFSSGLLMATADGGERWSILPPAPSAGQLVFASPSSATLVSNNGVDVWATQDAGQTWAAVPLPLPLSCEQCRVSNVGTVRFPASDAGFLTAIFFNPKTSSYSTTSFTSADQGRTWTADQQDTRLIATAGAQLNTVAGFHQLHLGALPRQGQLFLQTKSGMQTLPVPAGIGTKGDITDASFTSASSGWILYETHGCSPAHPAPCAHNASVAVNLLSVARGVLAVITPPTSGAQAASDRVATMEVLRP